METKKGKGVQKKTKFYPKELVSEDEGYLYGIVRLNLGGPNNASYSDPKWKTAHHRWNPIYPISNISFNGIRNFIMLESILNPTKCAKPKINISSQYYRAI